MCPLYPRHLFFFGDRTTSIYTWSNRGIDRASSGSFHAELQIKMSENLRLVQQVRDRLPMPTAKLLCLVVGLLFLASIVYKGFLHPLRKIPGPTLARFTGLWRTYHYAIGDWHVEILRLHDTYGSVVRIAPNEVSVVDGETTKRLYGHGTSAKKTGWYQTWQVPEAADGFFAVQDSKNHAFLRKRVASAYSMSSMMKMEVYIQGCLDLLMSRLKKHADKGEIIDMSTWTVAFAYDVVGELAFGEQLGHLRTETDVKSIRKSIYDGFIVMSVLGHFRGQSRLVNNIFVNSLLEFLGTPNLFKSFTDWNQQRVIDRQAQLERGLTKERDDLLSHFLRMKGRDGQPASGPEILIENLQIV